MRDVALVELERLGGCPQRTSAKTRFFYPRLQSAFVRKWLTPSFCRYPLWTIPWQLAYHNNVIQN